MKKFFFCLSALSVTLLTVLCVCFASGTVNASTDSDITILFTNDLHSHLISSSNEKGEGGYAKLMSMIREQKASAPDAILVDGGDFSMGSLFQTVYTSSAVDLRVMGAMGYDVTTFGEHEYDYSSSGLQSMLNAALDSGESLPSVVCANYKPAKKGQPDYDPALYEAWNRYGIKDYMIMERGGVYFVIFGILGSDAGKELSNAGMVFEDPIKTAKKTVADAVEDCKESYGADPVVICLSHSGTENGKGEDYKLAKSVDGIDVIISGHSHVKLDQPISVNDTLIVSADDYGKYLGVIKLTRDGKLKSYELLPVYKWVVEDTELAEKIEAYKKEVDAHYLSDYGFTFDSILLSNPYTFDTVGQVYSTQHESTLGNLIADAYRLSAERLTGERVDLALTASGVIKATLPTGNVTVFDIFNIAPYANGESGKLISVYITGKDLKNLIEMDASCHSLLPSAQIFMSGAEYSVRTDRLIFNKSEDAMLRNDDGTLSEIEEEKLYRLVTGMDVGLMFESIKKKTLGVLSVTPRDADGSPIAAKELVNFVIGDENGGSLTEWYAIASYLQTMDGEMSPCYAQTDGRKRICQNSNMTEGIFNTVGITDGAVISLIRLVLFGTGIVISLAAVLVTVIVLRNRKAKKRQ